MTEAIVHRLEWDTGEGTVYPVPLREIRGGRDGPTVLLVGGEHGIELSGPAGIDAVCRELPSRDLAGRVLAIPSIAPCNIRYRNHTYGQPHGEGYTFDMPYNTYAKWPGTPDGDPAERLARKVWDEAVARADVVINFHTWSRNSAGCLFTRGDAPGMRDLALAFGNVFNDLTAPAEGPLLHGTALAAGKRAMLIEMQGQWRIEPDSFERVRAGILRVLVHLGMLDEAVPPPPPFFSVGREEAVVKAPRAGLYVPLTPIETEVAAGEPLGYLLDLESGERTEIVSPVAGALWLNARTGPAADVRLRGLHAYADADDTLALVKILLD